MRTVNPDVVDVCDDGFKGFWIPLLLSGRRPVIYERHVSRMIQTEGKAPSVFMKMEFAAMRFLGGRFARFVVPASGNRAEWNMRNVEVIPNPLPFYPSVPSSGKEKRVIAVGKISPQKNYGAMRFRRARSASGHAPCFLTCTSMRLKSSSHCATRSGLYLLVSAPEAVFR